MQGTAYQTRARRSEKTIDISVQFGVQCTVHLLFAILPYRQHATGLPCAKCQLRWHRPAV